MNGDVPGPTARVRMRGISRRFGDLVALDRVDLDLYPGEIHALLGENGAGKTTLVNVLFGVYKADAGDVRIDGNPVTIDCPRTALDHGVGMVHQHARLVETFTVIESLILCEGAGSRLALDAAGARLRLETISLDVGLKLDPDTSVASLSVGQRQRLEILKALWRGSRVLVLDEPTAGLAPGECDSLLKILQSLARGGLAVAMITHQLPEVLAVAHRVTVLRLGRRVHHGLVADATGATLATAMIGEDLPVPSTLVPAPSPAPPPLLSVTDLVVGPDDGLPWVSHVAFHVGPGEIVGVAGVDGNGQSELVKGLVGLLPVRGGRVLLENEDITGWTAGRIRTRRLAYVPADRHRDGLVLDLDLAENLTLGSTDPDLESGLWGPTRVAGSKVQALLESFDVRPSDPRVPARRLSGGNQQKLMLARALSTGTPRVLVVSHPTRGLDIGATSFVHQRLRDAAGAGAAVLWVGASLDELMQNCHRILVMYGGRLVGAQSGPDFDRSRLGACMAGLAQ